jgi:hypothetical protein
MQTRKAQLFRDKDIHSIGPEMAQILPQLGGLGKPAAKTIEKA